MLTLPNPCIISWGVHTNERFTFAGTVKKACRTYSTEFLTLFSKFYFFRKIAITWIKKPKWRLIKISSQKSSKVNKCWASLVAQWLRVCLPMQGTWVRALVWEDPTCCGATGPVSHNYWACASGDCAPQQERPRWWEARAPRWRMAPTCRNWRKPSHRGEDPTQP